jgi:hypothetical protein
MLNGLSTRRWGSGRLSDTTLNALSIPMLHPANMRLGACIAIGHCVGLKLHAGTAGGQWPRLMPSGLPGATAASVENRTMRAETVATFAISRTTYWV